MIAANLESLEIRRIKKDVIFLYKIINGLVNLNFGDFFEYSTETRTRGNSRKIFVKQARVNIVLKSFTHRVVPVWNALNDETVTARSLNLFKKKLELESILETFLTGRLLI